MVRATHCQQRIKVVVLAASPFVWTQAIVRQNTSRREPSRALQPAARGPRGLHRHPVWRKRRIHVSPRCGQTVELCIDADVIHAGPIVTAAATACPFGSTVESRPPSCTARCPRSAAARRSPTPTSSCDRRPARRCSSHTRARTASWTRS